MGAIFSPIFPSHRHTLWARNFSFEYVKWGYLKFHPLKGFFDTIIRLACRSQNVVLPFTRSPWEPFFPLFFPLIAIPYVLEICPLSMLNGAISNFTPWKDLFLRSSVRPVGPKTWWSFWRVKIEIPPFNICSTSKIANTPFKYQQFDFKLAFLDFFFV